jgi:DtxR family Mn-dependent transcriptional regulator
MMLTSFSQSMQDYLKAILHASEHGAAQTSDIAQRLGVSPASVSGMIKKLAELRLVDYERHRGVSLTQAGRKVALEVLRHHRLIELYLSEALGYTWDEVHEEAEKLEHHISEDFEDRIAKILGDPKYDPHGDPIPTKDGLLPPNYNHPLSSVAINASVFVRRVSDDRLTLLKHLRDLGIGLNTKLTVVARDQETGTIIIRKHHTRISLPLEDCTQIFVEQSS